MQLKQPVCANCRSSPPSPAKALVSLATPCDVDINCAAVDCRALVFSDNKLPPNKTRVDTHICLFKKELLNLHNKDYIKGIVAKYLQSADESVVKLVLADHNSHNL